eukprot:gene19623-20073_t
MSHRIFVGKILPDTVTEADLQEAFSKYGDVTKIDFKGTYAFVFYDELEDCEAAIKHLDGAEINGSEVTFTNVFTRDQQQVGVIEFATEDALSNALNTLEDVPLKGLKRDLEILEETLVLGAAITLNDLIAIPLLTIDDRATNMIQGIASAVIGEVVMVEALPQISEEREEEEASIAIEEISEEEEEEEATVVLEDMTTEDPLEAMTTEGLQEEDILMEGGSGVFMCYDYVVPLAAHPAVFSVEQKGLGHDLVKEEVEAILLMHLAMDMRQEAVDITEVIMVAAVEVDMEMIEDIPLEGSTMALLAVDEEEEEVDTTLGSGMNLAVGTGSTGSIVIDRVSTKLKSQVLSNIRIIPGSEEMKRICISLGIPVCSIDDVTTIHLAIVGADEVDPSLAMLKGRTGSFLREKMLEQAANIVVVAVDDSKLARKLGFGA